RISSAFLSSLKAPIRFLLSPAIFLRTNPLLSIQRVLFVCRYPKERGFRTPILCFRRKNDNSRHLLADLFWQIPLFDWLPDFFLPKHRQQQVSIFLHLSNALIPATGSWLPNPVDRLRPVYIS